MNYRLPDNTPALLRSAGLVVKETAGWKTRGRPSSTGSFAPKGVLCHHTATGPKTSNATVERLLINGRSDLPGPLCHFGLQRDGTVVIIAAGRANHAGTARRSGPIPQGDGNSLYIGIEAYNDGVNEAWSTKQKQAYALLCAVLCVKFLKVDAEYVRAHKETSRTGKIDPKFDMDAFRDAVALKIAALKKPTATPRPLFDMTVASNNLQSYPKNPKVITTINATKTNNLIGFQEADLPEFKDVLRRIHPWIACIGKNSEPKYAAPFQINRNLFELLRHGFRFMYWGKKGISHTRYLSWGIAREKKKKVRFGIINFHAVDTKNDALAAERDKRMVLCKAAVKKQVDAFIEEGLPIVITCDQNELQSWFGTSYRGRRVQSVAHRVDRIYFIDTPHRKWKILSSSHVNTPSNHDALLAKVRLSAV